MITELVKTFSYNCFAIVMAIAVMILLGAALAALTVFAFPLGCLIAIKETLERIKDK